jgi:hypothetical protein
MVESASTWEGTIAALAQRMTAVERELETLDLTHRERSEAVDASWQALAGWQAKLEACRERRMVLEEMVSRQEGFTEHAGIAGGISCCNPAFIPEQHIHPIPGQVLTIQGAVGTCRGTAAGEGNLGPIPLVKGELDPNSDLLRTATGQLGAIAADLKVVGGHQSHSVWKAPA